jgi:hypothetical protein
VLECSALCRDEGGSRSGRVGEARGRLGGRSKVGGKRGRVRVVKRMEGDVKNGLEKEWESLMNMSKCEVES